MKIRPVEAEFFHSGRCTDGQLDKTKMTVAFHNFANASKIIYAFTHNAENIFHGYNQVGSYHHHIIYFRRSVQDYKSIWIWKMVTSIQSVQKQLQYLGLWLHIAYLT
jgi:hypothetical protein